MSLFAPRAARRALLGLLLAAWGVATPAEVAPQFVADGAKVPFFRFAVAEDTLSGAPDRSALNRPLDAAARVFVRDGHFFAVGADGKPGTTDDTRVRLYGINLTFAANFPSAEDAGRLALRLRRLGMNAVRLHHLDTEPDTRNDPPRSILTPGPFPSFNPVALERLRRFVEVLAKEGIYVDLNLHVGYRFRAAVDKLPPFDGGAKASALTSPVYMYTPRMADLEEAYARQLIRGLNLRGQPALALVEISNESSLAAAWRRREWQAAVPTAYAPELRRQWQQWVAQHYGSAAAACKAWDSCAQADGPIELLAPDDADASAGASAQLMQRLKDRWRRMSSQMSSRVFGAQAAERADDTQPTGQALRTQDFLRFLAETDRRYFDRMRRVVQEETDRLVPVTGTQMAYGGVLNFDANEGQDYVDEHFYVDHPDFPGNSWNPNDWRIRDVSLSNSGLWMDRLLALAWQRDQRKPFVVSEYSQPFPNRQGAEAAPLIAAFAAQQDWDGLFMFDYMDGDTWGDAPTSFTLAGDWGRYALVGASAQIFRTPLVAPLPDTLVLPLPAALRLAVAAGSDRQGLDALVAARYGVQPVLALHKRLSVLPTENAPPVPPQPRTDTAAPPPAAAALVADREHNTVLLRTPQARGFFGFPEQGMALGDGTASVTLAPGARGYAAMLLTSLDGQPIANARRLLLSIGGAVRGTQPGSQPQRPTDLVRYRSDRDRWTFEPDPTAPGQPSGSRDTHGPMWVERTPAQLSFATTGRRATVYPLDGSGKRGEALRADQVKLTGGRLTLPVQADARQASLWYEVLVE
ncbi:MAG: capsular biosynthesis protein [Pseudomonadota bacterium]